MSRLAIALLAAATFAATTVPHAPWIATAEGASSGNRRRRKTTTRNATLIAIGALAVLGCTPAPPSDKGPVHQAPARVEPPSSMTVRLTRAVYDKPALEPVKAHDGAVSYSNPTVTLGRSSLTFIGIRNDTNTPFGLSVVDQHDGDPAGPANASLYHQATKKNGELLPGATAKISLSWENGNYSGWIPGMTRIRPETSSAMKPSAHVQVVFPDGEF